MRKITLLGDFNPNTKNNIYYYKNTLNPQAFLNTINQYRKLTLNVDNYRINTNVLKIAFDENLGDIFYKQLTYVIEYDDENINVWQCYFIKNVIIQSKVVLFDLEMDFWQSYIHLAKFKNSVITRSNKKVGVGLYEPITLTDGNLTNEGVNGETINDNNVTIVFLLQYNVAQQIVGGEYITRTNLFYINLKELKDHLITIDEDAVKNKSSLQLATDFVGLIYGVEGFSITHDAQVLKAWVIPQDKILTWTGAFGSYYYLKCKSRSSYISNSADIEFNIIKANPYIAKEEIVISNYDLNKDYILGTFNNGLQLTRFTNENLNASYVFITKDDEMQVIVQQGNKQTDITSAFEVALTTNGELQTGVRKIANVLKTSMSMYESVSSGFNASVKGAVSLIDMTPNFKGVIGGGDGTTTFYRPQFNEETYNLLKNPYTITTTTSIHDEVEHALRFGGTFNEIYNNDNVIEIVLNSDFLQDNTNYNYETLLACETSVYGIPNNARERIEQILEGGVFIKQW